MPHLTRLSSHTFRALQVSSGSLSHCFPGVSPAACASSPATLLLHVKFDTAVGLAIADFFPKSIIKFPNSCQNSLQLMSVYDSLALSWSVLDFLK